VDRAAEISKVWIKGNCLHAQAFPGTINPFYFTELELYSCSENGKEEVLVLSSTRTPVDQPEVYTFNMQPLSAEQLKEGNYKLILYGYDRYDKESRRTTQHVIDTNYIYVKDGRIMPERTP
jgi:hypothetical protein